MDGSCLDKYLHWVDDATANTDSFFSEDVDWFLGTIPKDQWLLIGISMCALTKSILESKEVHCPVAVIFSLHTTKHRSKAPKSLTCRTFRDVSCHPTIYIFKGYNKEILISEEKRFLSRFEKINNQDLKIPLYGDLFYCEKHYFEGNDSYVDRFIMFLQ